METATTVAARSRRLAVILAVLMSALLGVPAVSLADTAAQTVPFTQNWSNTALINSDDDWSGVPGIVGYRGDALVASTGVDPQTVVADGSATPLDVNADETNPNTFTTGGIAEFSTIADPSVALQGSGTADAPHLVVHLTTLGVSSVNVSYNLRDIDGSADNAVQQVALQYRVGSVGSFTNVPAGYVADATTGPSLATLVTPINLTLPAAVDNQADVQLRIITTDAVGSDEWVGVDDISVTGQSGPTELFFSEYIEGTSNNKAVEIYNSTGAPVNLASAAYDYQGYHNGSPTATFTVALTGTVAAGDVYVLANPSANATILAQADQTSGNVSFNGNDAVVLRRNGVIIDVIGQIGFDPGAAGWGTDPTNTTDNTLRRKCSIDAGDPNGADVFDPSVEWDGFAVDSFGGLGTHTNPCPTDVAPSVTATSPADGAVGVPVGSNIDITFSEAVNVSGAWFDIACTTSGTHTATGSGGPTSFALDPDADFTTSESCTVTILAAQVTDQDAIDPPDNMASDHVFAFQTVLPVTPIHEIQGAAHLSIYDGTSVSTTGIVTAERSNGFWVQDPSPDADDATSEGIFVFTSTLPTVNPGDSVDVTGTVDEFRPGGALSGNLTITEITSPSVVINSSGNPLPTATVVGAGGRVPPTTVIEDDAAGDVETSGIFDPASDGIDFYESLEGMLLQVNDPVASGPTNDFGEVSILVDDGAAAGLRTGRGGTIIQANDFNPERIILDDVIADTPDVNTGDHFTTDIVGVLDYSFGNFKLYTTSALVGVDEGLVREVATAPTTLELSVATLNVENLDPGDGTKFADLADLIVNNLQSPDLLTLEEVQDNNGATNDTVVAADATLDALVAAITTAGGPSYEWRQIDPADDQDGGEPGGNIRVAFLFRTDRGLSFVDRPGGDATTGVSVVSGSNGPELSISPGRIDPTNAAFANSRKPLAGEFEWNGRPLIVVANHWNSKGGDEPLFGQHQPPTLVSEIQRTQQAQVVNDFIDTVLAVDPSANIVVAGDLNDFAFSTPLATLTAGGVLNQLSDTLPASERYSYVFDGNSQQLDHILVSDNLLGSLSAFDLVHVNAEFDVQVSDHDPAYALFEASRELTALSDAHVWVGLKNSDDQGTRFDIQIELLKNGTPIASGLQRCVTGVTRNPSLAKEVIVAWNGVPAESIATGDVLALRVSTRIGTNPDNTKCTPGHNNAVGLRLYYDATTRASRFDLTITPDPSVDEFLRSDGNACANAESTGVTTRYLSSAAPTAFSAKCKDSSSINFAGGNLFRVIGTWSAPPQL